MGHSCGVGTITDANYISNFVGERLISKGLRASPVSLRRHSHDMADLPDTKLVYLSKGRQGLVVMISPPQFPEVVAEECRKTLQMRSQLGDLGAPILEPLDSGHMESCSYAVMPYRKPLSSRRGMQWVHRIWVKRHLLEWLLQVAQRRSGTCEESQYRASLDALGERVAPDSPTAALLQMGQSRLRSGRFAPRTTPMHGDLWKGNVLHGVGSTAFTLVDWRGSEIQGFPLFDLIRTAGSFGLSPKALSRELQLHRAALGCQIEDLPLYLLGALGHYAAHLGEMSPDLFRSMADECAQRLSSALDASATFAPLRLLANGHGRHAPT